MGPVGPVGIDYNVMPTVLRMRGIKRGLWADLFTDLQVMEQEALTMFAEKREK
jgi:hypothetical protein